MDFLERIRRLIAGAHFLFYTVREFFDFVGLANDIQRKHILIRFIHSIFQLRRQLEQVVGITFDVFLASMIGLLG